jgi:hypothetical protein
LAHAAPITVSYQSGVNGYGSTQDLAINNQTAPTGASVQSYRLLINNGTGAYESRALLRFDSLNLPVGAVVTSAALTLNYYRATSGNRLHAYYLQNAWDYTAPSAVNWVSRSWSQQWAAPGAGGDGTDRLPGPTIIVTPTSTGEGVTTSPLNLYQVQRWVTERTRNFGGLVIVNETPDKPVWLYSSQQSKASQRPKLTLTYYVDATPPTATITAPTSGASVMGTISLAASASSTKSILGVQFVVDGVDFRSERSSAPAQVSLDTRTLQNGTHTVAVRVRDNTGLSTTSVAVPFVVANDVTGPTVAITSPVAGTSLTSATSVTASATDPSGVSSLQFTLDGAPLGPVLTSAPFQTTLDPASLAEGPHSLGAYASDSVGNRGTSNALVVTVPTRQLTRTFYISTQGNDNWSGALPDPNSTGTDGPFKTLDRARDMISTLRSNGVYPPGGVSLLVRGGIYPRTKTLEFWDVTGGQSGGPVTLAAYNGEDVHITGGVALSGWTSVTDPAIAARLGAAAPNVMQVNLKALGITDFGSLIRRGDWGATRPGAMELVFGTEPMTLARYPNSGFLNVTSAPAGRFGGQFTYSDSRPTTWAASSDIWVDGYWFFDWDNSYEQVSSLNAASGTVYTTAPGAPAGYRAYAAGQQGGRFYFMNVLEELDSPGEYYIDRGTGILYFWPPSSLSTTQAYVTNLGAPLISLSGATDVTLRGLTIENGRDRAVLVTGGARVHVESCTLRNLSRDGAYFQDATDSLITRCDISDTGDSAVWVTSGDRLSLTPGNVHVTSNRIHSFSRWGRSFTPGIRIGGVGNGADHNEVYDAPGHGIFITGNDHLVEYNNVHDVCQEVRDVGAFYIGRDWCARGNLVRYNYFHSLPTAPNELIQAVYLDDLSCGTTVYGNLFYRAGRGVMVGGGRDNTIQNNVFLECQPSIQIDERGMRPSLLSSLTGPTPTDTSLYDALTKYNATSPTSPYAKYPHMTNLLSDEPARCKYNQFINNISYNTPSFLDLSADNLGCPIVGAAGGSPIVLTNAYWDTMQTGRRLAVSGVGGVPGANGVWSITKVDERHFSLDGSSGSGAFTGGGYACSDYITVQNNWSTIDPLFVDYAGGNFQLKDTSPVLTQGFQKLPLDQIGLLP